MFPSLLVCSASGMISVCKICRFTCGSNHGQLDFGIAAISGSAFVLLGESFSSSAIGNSSCVGIVIDSGAICDGWLILWVGCILASLSHSSMVAGALTLPDFVVIFTPTDLSVKDFVPHGSDALINAFLFRQTVLLLLGVRCFFKPMTALAACIVSALEFSTLLFVHSGEIEHLLSALRGCKRSGDNARRSNGELGSALFGRANDDFLPLDRLDIDVMLVLAALLDAVMVLFGDPQLVNELFRLELFGMAQPGLYDCVVFEAPG